MFLQRNETYSHWFMFFFSETVKGFDTKNKIPSKYITIKKGNHYMSQCLKAHLANYSWKVVFDKKNRFTSSNDITRVKWKQYHRWIPSLSKIRREKRIYFFLDDALDIDWLRPSCTLHLHARHFLCVIKCSFFMFFCF